MWPNVWGGQHLIIDKPSCWRNVLRRLILKKTDNDTRTTEKHAPLQTHRPIYPDNKGQCFIYL